MDSELEKQRGEQAAYILEHPLVREALNAMRDSLAAQRQVVKLSDTGGHTRLIIAEQVAIQFENYLKAMIQTGRAAKFTPTPTLTERMFRR